MGEFWVGAAAQEITPPAAWIEQGRVFLWGYGFRTTPTRWVRDPLWARAMSCRDRLGSRIVLVTLDVGALAPALTQAIRDRAEKSRGVPGEHVVVHATHTHSAPPVVAIPTWNPGIDRTDPEYMALLQDQAVAAIEQAIDGEQPASLTWTRGTSHIGINRHFPGGAYDSSLDVVKASDEQGRTIATVFCHGCHATTLRDYDAVSADFPGVAREGVERAMGGIAIYLQGFAGTIKPATADPDVVGTALAQDVLAALREPARELQGTVAVRSAAVDLPLQPLDPGALARVSLGDDANMKLWAAYMAALGDAAPSAIPTPLQAIRVGSPPNDWVLAASAHEVTAEFVSPIRGGAPHPRVSLVGYTNSVMGYVPSPMVLAVPPCEFPSWVNYDGSMSFAWYGHRAPLTAEAGSIFAGGMLHLLRPWQTNLSTGVVH